MIRQGDVLLVKTNKKPEGVATAPRNGRIILAEGEATGHHHSVDAQVCELFGDLLVVREATPLTHQEHGLIEIQPGTWWVVRQREYTPQEIRRVQD